MWKPLAAALLASLALAACSDRGQPESSAVKPAAEGEGLRPPQRKDESPTLQRVQARGRLNCGVNGDLAGFSWRDAHEAWRGFDVDFCRAVAAAVLGDSKAVNFTVLDDRTRFAALQSGVVDILSRDTAWTFARDAALGVDFAGVAYYDGLGFMVPKGSKATAPADLAGKRICVAAGASQQTLADYFKGAGLAYTAVPADSEAEARSALEAKSCDALTGGLAGLAAARVQLSGLRDYAILPQAISKEPLGPVVREGDDGWEDIVRWTLNAMILAEESGVTAATAADARRTSTDPQVRRLLGVEGGYGRLLGLNDDWAFRIVRQVGSYGEIFDRDLGAQSPLKLERGSNALWSAEPPGLIYSPPMR